MVQVAKDTVVSKSDVVSVLVELRSMDVTFKRFVENIKTVVSNFRLFPAEAVEYLSIRQHLLWQALKRKSRAARPLLGGGELIRVVHAYG